LCKGDAGKKKETFLEISRGKNNFRLPLRTKGYFIPRASANFAKKVPKKKTIFSSSL